MDPSPATSDNMPNSRIDTASDSRQDYEHTESLITSSPIRKNTSNTVLAFLQYKADQETHPSLRILVVSPTSLKISCVNAIILILEGPESTLGRDGMCKYTLLKYSGLDDAGTIGNGIQRSDWNFSHRRSYLSA